MKWCNDWEDFAAILPRGQSTVIQLHKPVIFYIMDLISACESNNQEEVERYLDQHPDSLDKIFKKHFEEATPLYFSAQYGHLAIVNILLRVSYCVYFCQFSSIYT